MANKKKKINVKRNNDKNKNVEDTTQYGEFISSFDQWTTYEKQKENSRYLEEIGKLNDEKAKKRRKS